MAAQSNTEHAIGVPYGEETLGHLVSIHVRGGNLIERLYGWRASTDEEDWLELEAVTDE